jgi:hypothetical protein
MGGAVRVPVAWPAQAATQAAPVVVRPAVRAVVVRGPVAWQAAALVAPVASLGPQVTPERPAAAARRRARPVRAARPAHPSTPLKIADAL